MTQNSLLQKFKRDFLANNKDVAAPSPTAPKRKMDPSKIPQEYYNFEKFKEYKTYQTMEWYFDKQGFDQIYFCSHSDHSEDTILVGNRRLINFSGYNYLGLSGEPRVKAAAIRAIERYGTSTSAGRNISGEIDLHSEFEAELCKVLKTEACVVSYGGYSTNAFSIGYLCRRNYLILYDELVHNSAIVGCELTGARRLSFPHNDFDTLERLLEEHRGDHERVLVLVEGAYSMDGDIPDIPRVIEIKNRYRALLMVDEAHSMGVIGPNGLGVMDHFDIEPGSIDILYSSLSKSFGSCGGYVAGSKALVSILKFYAPGIVLYGAAPTPANTAAALEALRIMQAEPERARRVQESAHYFASKARAAGLDCGDTAGTGIVPVILRDSELALWLSAQLWKDGICAHAILYPAVPKDRVRLRFFINCAHSVEQLDFTLERLMANLAHAPASKGYI